MEEKEENIRTRINESNHSDRIPFGFRSVPIGIVFTRDKIIIGGEKHCEHTLRAKYVLTMNKRKKSGTGLLHRV